MSGTCGFAAAVVGALAFMGAAASAGAAEADGVLAITLDKAANGRPLELYLDVAGGKIGAAVAVAPTFSKVAPDVDTTKLAFDGKTLHGELGATYNSDGFTPPIGKPVRASYTLDVKLDGSAAAGTFSGKYDANSITGAAVGTLGPRLDLSGLVLVKLSMINAEGKTKLDKGVWGRVGSPSFVMKGGKIVQAVMHGHGGGRQIEYFESVITRSDLKFGAGSFGGTMDVESSKGEKYAFTLNARAAGGHIAGSFGKKVDGAAAEGNRFTGTVEAIKEIAPGDAVWNMELIGAVPAGKQLNTFVPCVAGRCGDGMGYSGAWNHTYHDVAGGALAMSGGAMKGTMKVTMNPDPYMPPDHKAVPCSYEINAKYADGCVAGTFKGTFGGKEVSGPIFGKLMEIPPAPEPASVYLKLDNGTCDGAPWFRRAYIGFVATKGKADKGGFSNNKGGWTGTFKNAEIEYDGTTFKATINASVDTTHSSKTGNYTFKLTGKSIGGELIGKCDTYLEGKPAKQGTDFMGGIGPVKK